MRGTTSGQIIHRGKDGRFVGVGLGADFCAEHEWGTKELGDKFGLPAAKIPQGGWGRIVPVCEDVPMGIDRYVITKGEVYPFEFTKETTDWDAPRDKNGRAPKVKMKLYGLTSTDITTHWRGRPNTPEERRERIDSILAESHVYPRKDPKTRVYAAWDSRDFALAIENKEDRDVLLEAFKNKDICMWLGGAGVFNNGTFNVLIRSRIPQEIRDLVKKDHISDLKLQKAFKATGIEQKLRDAKCTYFALSPSWDDKEETKLRFWLNPEQQDKYNSMWCTIQDLEDWMKGTGRIIKVRQEAR